MALLYLLEILVIIVVIVLLSTQVIIPLIIGRPLFSLWRRMKGEREIAAAYESYDEKKMKQQAERIRAVRDHLEDIPDTEKEKKDV